MEFEDYFVLSNVSDVFPNTFGEDKPCVITEIVKTRDIPTPPAETIKSDTAIVVICDGFATNEEQCKKQTLALGSKLLQLNPDVSPSADLYGYYLPPKEPVLDMQYGSWQTMIAPCFSRYILNLTTSYKNVSFIAASLGCILLSDVLQILHERGHIKNKPFIAFIEPGFDLQFPYLPSGTFELSKEEEKHARFRIL